MAKLVVLSEEFAGSSCDLKAEPTTIGRVEDNAFPLPEGSVSSHHCEVFLRGNEVVVRDLNSTNGTFIDGEQVNGESVVKPGQILRLGQVELRLEGNRTAPTAPAPAAPAPAKPAPTAPAPAGSGSRPAPAAAPDPAIKKQKQEHTRVIPQGVTLDELEQGSRPVAFGPGGPFEKKNNKGTKLVIAIAVVLGVVILAILVFSLLRVSG